MLLESGDSGGIGVLGDQIDDPAPRADGKVVSEAGDGLQAGAGYRSRGRGSSGGVHHPVTVAVDHQGRDIDVAKFGGAVSGGEDARELADESGGAGVSVPGDARVLPHRAFVE